jgi:hypothetical protein
MHSNKKHQFIDSLCRIFLLVIFFFLNQFFSSSKLNQFMAISIVMIEKDHYFKNNLSIDIKTRPESYWNGIMQYKALRCESLLHLNFSSVFITSIRLINSNWHIKHDFINFVLILIEKRLFNSQALHSFALFINCSKKSFS